VIAGSSVPLPDEVPPVAESDGIFSVVEPFPPAEGTPPEQRPHDAAQ
jgi:hypothetical protein